MFQKKVQYYVDYPSYCYEQQPVCYTREYTQEPARTTINTTIQTFQNCEQPIYELVVPKCVEPEFVAHCRPRSKSIDFECRPPWRPPARNTKFNGRPPRRENSIVCNQPVEYHCYEPPQSLCVERKEISCRSYEY